MIVLLITALAVAALLAGGVTVARSRARERQRRDRRHQARLAAAAVESRAQEERRRTALEASEALTSVLPAIRLPRPRQPQESAPYGDGYPSFSDYPQFPAAVPFQAQEERAWYRDEMPGRYAAAGHATDEQAQHAAGFAAERTPPPAFPAERAPAPAFPAERAPAPAFPAERAPAPAFPAERAPAPAFPAERLAPAPPPSEWAAPAPTLAERSAPADLPHRRPGHGSHRGGHAKRRHG